MGEICYEVMDLEDLQDKCLSDKLDQYWDNGMSTMRERTKNFKLFSRLSHNQSLYQGVDKGKPWSEGSTQAIKRKLRAQTIQRVPDGEIQTQYDKNSVEQVELEYLFGSKVLTSEYDGKDMLKNLWRTFNYSYDYGFACVRTGFEKDLDGDVRISYKLINWNDVAPAPDCEFIEQAEWYMVREMMSFSAVDELLDENGDCCDPTYDAEVLRYLAKNRLTSGVEPNSVKLADEQKGVTPVESFEIRTLYKRGDDKFYTYVPEIRCVLRVVDNYDPRRDVPLHFMILEPDPEFPLGCSSVLWTLAQQQFADAFQTVSYQTLLLAANPPIMAYGNLTPSKIKMKPRAFWPMGTNPNNKVEKFPIETTTVTQYGSILENVSANMMKNLNVVDGTVASDANVMNYSGTPQGVQAQRADKTITVNQYQKRVEVFFSEWANHALRSYVASMSGKVWTTVDEETRRKIWDIQSSAAQADAAEGIESDIEELVDGNKVLIDFDALSADRISFEVRTGSLIENEKETERRAIQELLVPVSQMLNSVSDENKGAFEQNIMDLVRRLCELSNVDISQTAANRISDRLMAQSIKATMEEVMGQRQQIQGLQQAVMQMAGGQSQPPMPAPDGMPAPAPQGGPVPPQQPAIPEGMPTEVPTVPDDQMPPESAIMG